jgi:hypothetical protein
MTRNLRGFANKCYDGSWKEDKVMSHTEQCKDARAVTEDSGESDQRLRVKLIEQKLYRNLQSLSADCVP